MSDKRHDVEAAYDEVIHPLMQQVIAACTKHGIPMAARFQMNDDDDPLYCTTVLPEDWQSDDQSQLAVVMEYGFRTLAMAFAITTTRGQQ